MEEKKLKLINKIIVIACSVFSIILILGDWLSSLSQSLLGVSFDEGYTLFDIAEMLKGINELFENEIIAVLSYFFSIFAVVTILIFIAFIVTTALGKNAFNKARTPGLAAILLSAVFLLCLFYVNAEITDAVGIDKWVLLPTYRPFLLILLSVLIEIFISPVKKSNVPTAPVAGNYCINCGTRNEAGALFCSGCGKAVSRSGNASPADKKKESDQKTLDNGGWRCNNCGRANPSYTGTCACGNSKYTNQ